MKEKIELDLPIETLAYLAILSAELDKSVNWIIEKALKDYIKNHKRS